jgi:exodeoxyribonuclease-3
MELKVVTWNMAYWSHKTNLEEAWSYLLSLDADIFIVQEARCPTSLDGDKNFIWHAAGESNGRKSWGSGIYSKKHQLTKEPETSIPEWSRDRFNELCAVANTVINTHNFTFISLYGRMDKIGNLGYSIPNLHRIFSDLTGILKGHIDGKRQIVLAGDLNASIQFDQQYGGQSHRIFFERLKDLKLENCFELNGNKDFIQTLRYPKSNILWQNDYCFISESLSKQFTTCEVIDNDEVKKYSDHNPVMVTLDI